MAELRSVGGSEESPTMEHRDYETHWVDDPWNLTEDLFQPMRDMDDDQFEALVEDIRQRSIEDPIWVNQEWAILDGHQRVRAWKHLIKEGVEVGTVEVRMFNVTDEEAYRDSFRRNIQRRNLDVDDVDQLILQHLRHVQAWYAKHGLKTSKATRSRHSADFKDWRQAGPISDSNSRVARFLGTNSHRIARVRLDAERRGDLAKAIVYVGGYDADLRGGFREGMEEAGKKNLQAGFLSGRSSDKKPLPYRIKLPNDKEIATDSLEALQAALNKTFEEDEEAHEKALKEVQEEWAGKLDQKAKEKYEKQIQGIRQEVEGKLVNRESLKEGTTIESLPAWAWEEAIENAKERRIANAGALLNKLSLAADQANKVDPEEMAEAFLQQTEKDQEVKEKRLKKMTGFYKEFFDALYAYKKSPVRLASPATDE